MMKYKPQKISNPRRITLTFDEDLFKQITFEATRLGISKADFIRRTLKSFLNVKKRYEQEESKKEVKQTTKA